MSQVAAVRTPFTNPQEFARRLFDVYRDHGLDDSVAVLLTAHSALATGWGRNVWNNNVGVIRANPDWIRQGRPWTDRSTREVIDGETVRLQHAAWRVYATLDESVFDLLRLLRAPRYREARRLLMLADPEWFLQLGLAGFYTQPAHEHARSYASVLRRTRRLLGLGPGPLPQAASGCALLLASGLAGSGFLLSAVLGWT